MNLIKLSNWDQIHWVFYDTIGGKGPTGADIGGSGANCGEEIGAVDWMVDWEDIPDTDVEDDAENKTCSISHITLNDF